MCKYIVFTSGWQFDDAIHFRGDILLLQQNLG